MINSNDSPRAKTRGVALAELAAGGALAIAVGSTAGSGSVATEFVTSANAQETPTVSTVVPQTATADEAFKSVSDIQGIFSWNQGVVASNATLARSLYGASAVLCSSQSGDLETADGQAETIDQILVTGDVSNSFTAEVSEYEQKAPMRTTLGCTCMGNPADGRASANADVAGFRLIALIEDAQPADDANTITFVCSDGYEVSLPLRYVEQHYSIIVTQVNGENAADAVGCANQLWLGSTSARSYARNIVEIRITAEAEPPLAPGMSEDANQPNVGVLEGTAQE